ncbi:hypothetical protein Adt_39531 [Abeliophyllum distichum]|uniref:Uncharacterized protein n=1 Tax=Abeliophyllum distichum TaxID=126358 RepID=A0ABD1Q5C9_9LAMI
MVEYVSIEEPTITIIVTLRTRFFRIQHLSFRELPLLPSLSYLGLDYSVASIFHLETRISCQASPTWDDALPQPASSICASSIWDLASVVILLLLQIASVVLSLPVGTLSPHQAQFFT